MTNLVPWRRQDVLEAPQTPRRDFWREFDELFDDFFRDDWFSAPRMRLARFNPAFDISETEDEIVLKGEVPGIDPEEIHIDLTDAQVTIRGEKKEELSERGASYQLMERSYGSFSRSFRLPCDVQDEKVKAIYSNEVLELRLPKATAVRRRRINVEIA